MLRFPVVVTVKNDKSVKSAVDARKVNDSSMKRPHMPNMDKLNQTSFELSKNESDPSWISVTELDYAYRQMRLAPETCNHSNFAVTGETINGHYRFPMEFYEPADIPTNFQEERDQTLDHQSPVWLDDIIFVTHGTKERNSTPNSWNQF